MINTPDTITLNQADYQEAIDALKLAGSTIEQLAALLTSIKQSDNLNHVKRLADMGCVYSDDMANYFDCAREALEGANHA